MAKGRSPCGERGLKCGCLRASRPLKGSLPVRGAWIEMSIAPRTVSWPFGRSPCGERGLKYDGAGRQQARADVAPRAGSVD